jgi:Zn-dependent M16 (insulinase) family peptidase
MKINLREGQTVNGFVVLETADLGELNAVGVLARHEKTGAEIFHVVNDDEENLFAFAFATAPEDSTGVTHIIEHSTLCGSEKYPLKDAFLTLAQGSLQTYLNAWTFPDKTVYPASSVNESDYFNLMSVYADAVFHPLLSEWTFMQEGHRLEVIEDAGGKKLSITGVVYNEMKGAYSAPDTYTERWASKTVLEGTPYAYESGGDPDCIPDLTFAAFKDFYKRRYAPANCRIFLAGNIPTEKQFAFLDKILAGLSAGEHAPALPKAEKWDAPKKVRIPCPASGDQKASVLLSWLCGDAADAESAMALTALSEILLGNDGAPLYKALVESEIGEDVSPASGFEADLRQTVFAAGLRGVDLAEKSAEDVETLVLGELRRLVNEGIPRKDIDAAVISMEFSNREIRRSQGPYSLVWLVKSLRGWLHNRKPWESLLFLPAFNAVKENLARNPRYFESLIQKYLLDNPHRALLTVEPEADFLEKKEAALEKKLSEKQKSLSKAELAEIERKSAELEKLQSAKEPPETASAIPHLSRKDLSPEIQTVPREFFDAGGLPVLAHNLFTNGVTYINLAFPLDLLPPEDYPWFTLFARAASGLGVPGMDYAEMSNLLARTVGDLSPALKTGRLAPGASRSAATPSGVFDLRGRDWLVWNLKCLDEKTKDGLKLALDLITQADFSDLRRLSDILLNFKNEAASSVAPEGHSYVSTRAGRFFSRDSAVEEIWNGIYQLEFIQKLTAMDIGAVGAKLESLKTAIASAGVLANITGSDAAIRTALPLIEEKFSRFGQPKPRKDLPEEAFFSLFSGAGNEAWASPSLQVGFAGKSVRSAPYATREYSAELTLGHYLSTGELWENIRMKGGAYGAFASVSGAESFRFSTYRDPEPSRSLPAFIDALKKTSAEKISAETLEKTIIGAYAKDTRPQTPAQKGLLDCFRWLYGVEDGQRARVRRDLLDMEEEDLRNAAKRLASVQETADCVLAGDAPAEKAAKELGFELKRLPL